MKKIFVLWLVFVTAVTLTGCGGSQTDALRILVPSGSPSLILAQSMVEASQAEGMVQNIRWDVEIVNGADPLVAAFTSNSHDIIFAPTNLGASMYNNNQHYQLAAVVVWGNNFILAREEEGISTISDLSGKKIIAYGRNSTPDIVLKTVLEANGMLSTVEIEYVMDVTTAGSHLLAGLNPIALGAEPSASKLESSVSLTRIDLQNAWNEATQLDGIPQVGVFMRKDASNGLSVKFEAFLGVLEAEIQFLIEEPYRFAQLAVLADKSFELLGVQAIVRSVAHSNYRYQSALEAKVAVDGYFAVLLSGNPNLIGGGMPNDEFYRETQNP